MEKLNLGKQHKAYYSAKTKPELSLIEPAQFISLKGKGDPSSNEFLRAIQALYSTAYALKFRWKQRGNDFVVAKLEAQWWFDESKFANVPMEEAPLRIPRAEWQYRMMIRMPDFVTAEEIEETAKRTVEKKNLADAKRMEHYKLAEHHCVQMLHVGPFSKEPETLKIMQEFIETNHLARAGNHHEIYLSDFRKTSEAKLRTILREPVLPPKAV